MSKWNDLRCKECYGNEFKVTISTVKNILKLDCPTCGLTMLFNENSFKEANT